MDDRSGRTRAVGREAEHVAVREFLAGPAPSALVLSGEPGIGKSTLWGSGIAAARELGLRVLSARPSETETTMAFAAITDLLEEIADLGGLELPVPQRHALEVALMRAEPEQGGRFEQRAVGYALLNALRSIAASKPTLVAIDDVPWLDSSSAEALVFVARRLEGEPIRFLLARRPGRATALERAFEPSRLRKFDVPPLSVGAIRRILVEQIGLSLPRRLLRRLYESAQGNPLFALELGRTLVDRPLPQIGEEIPFPETLEELVGSRVAELSMAAKRVLLAVALSTDLRLSQLASVVEPDAIDDALDAGVVAADGDRVRPAHPLLGAAALRQSRARERRLLHLELAQSAGDDRRRARHLALATAVADADVAATVATAAAGAAARGARDEAVELAEHALRLTPPELPERVDRLLTLALYLERAGEPQRVAALLEPEVDALPRGTARARAWLFLAEGTAVATQEDYLAYLDRALRESEDDPALRAHVLAKQANNAAAVRVAQIGKAEEWALEALRLASPRSDAEDLALYALAWARSFGGHAVDDLLERVAGGSGNAHYLRNSLDRVACDRLAWRGQVDEARSIARGLMSLADERGESRSYLAILSQLCEIELRAGELDAAARLLDEWEQTSSDRFVAPVYERCRALVAIYRGRPEEAEPWLPDVIARSERLGKGWDLLEGLRAQGIAELFAHQPERAVVTLRRVWEWTMREGIEDPGAFPVAPELVEALVETGELDPAQTVIDRLSRLSAEQAHPWGLVTARRCGALLELASGNGQLGQAASALTDAARDYGRLGLRLEPARTLFALGRFLRRRKQWAGARTALEQAAATFDQLGSPGYAEAARAELARVRGRRPHPPGELTPTERSVAELAADGLSNKEIASALFVSVKTVESHLSHAYAKLGVRSRGQLARHLTSSS